MYKTLAFVLLLWGVAICQETAEDFEDFDDFDAADADGAEAEDFDSEPAEEIAADDTNPLLIGGRPISITRAPYTVSLRYNGQFTCGGALLNNNTVITTGRCVYGRTAAQLSVGLGSANRVTTRTVRVSQVSIDPQFPQSDIAVLKLASRVRFSRRLRPVALAAADPADNACGLVTGWGTKNTTNTTASVTLQALRVQILGRAACQRIYSPITRRMICTKPISQKGICFGDAGDPLVVNRKLVGLASFALVGCAKGYPDVYADIPAALTFIRSRMIL